MENQKQEPREARENEAFKKKYYKLVAKRLTEIMEKHGVSQPDLIARCARNGYHITQPTLSKIKNSSAVSLINVVQICKALGVEVGEVLSLEEREEDWKAKNMNTYSSLIYRTDNPVFRGYLGKYNCYFYPTISSEERPLHANLEFTESSAKDKCNAYMELETKKFDEYGNPITKKYNGELIISVSMNIAYCILTSHDIGEMCFFLFHYLQINYEKLECRMASAITASAGDNRRPTSHRMLLCRSELSDEMLYYMEGQLLLNESEIYISKKGLEQLKEDPYLPEAFLKNYDSILSTAVLEEEYCIVESRIRDMFMSPEDKIKSISLLRRYSNAPRYNKIGTKSDEFVYQLLKKKGKDTEKEKALEKKMEESIIGD